ncbi:hypothetical protein, partial [Erwinia amylovora]|uniref:hypothetical protein n=1 Tax=Erwinia amylovora TaxID=552 RepID=UPI003B75C46E|nr:DUF3772 domain-containing protein [Erwinia amylovora]
VMCLQINKLACKVSAQSVGICYGIQHIDKTYKSGQILITERPEKDCEQVIIRVIERDIPRKKDPATEIHQLDTSTCILPNDKLNSHK